MKRLLLFLTVLLAPLAASAANYPEHTGFVTDTVGLLPPTIRDNLNAKLTLYKEATTIEIAVVIVPSLDGESESDYATNIGIKWGVGKKSEDNGVVLLVVPPPIKKAWIATGYGIGPWLTDVDCKHVVMDVMKPLNLQEKRAEAVVAGVDAIISKLGSSTWAERAKMKPPAPADAGWSTGAIIVLVIIGVLVLLLFLAWMSSYSGSGGYYSSGGYSGGGGSSSGGDSGGGSFSGGSFGGGGGGGSSG